MYRTMPKAEADRIVDERLWHSDHKKGSDFKRELRGDDVRRYSVTWNGKQWIMYGDWLARPREKRFFNEPRVLIQEITRGNRLRAAVTDEEFYNNPGIIIVVAKTFKEQAESSSLLYLAALLNSSLLFFWHVRTSPKAKLVTSIPKILVEDVAQLPIRRIPFATEAGARARFATEARRLYDACLADGDEGRLLSHAQEQLTAIPQRADVVHDLLTFLAGGMAELIDQEKTETTGFLTWLERKIGARVEDLANKTVLQAYPGRGIDALLDVLKKNRRRVAADPDSRGFQESIDREYNKSMKKLTPLKAKIAATDRLIDQIVYRLYGLTNKEIAIVEGD
jgi:hypothetical protein